MNHADSECSPAERLSWWELWPMLGWGVFVVYLYFEGRMIYFLRPAYGYLAVAGGGGSCDGEVCDTRPHLKERRPGLHRCGIMSEAWRFWRRLWSAFRCRNAG